MLFRLKRGHTLMELMTTVVIIMILASIAVASFTWVIPWVKAKLWMVFAFGDPVDRIK